MEGVDFDREQLHLRAENEKNRREVDVHSLRVTFCSQLAAAGVPLRTAQAAMRHSDPKLTANVYTGPTLLDIGKAVAQTPGNTSERVRGDSCACG